MLLTGSNDTTVRVWDVGEELLPHTDEWSSRKSQFALETQLDASFASVQNTTSIDNIAALEATVLAGGNHATVDGDETGNAYGNATAFHSTAGENRHKSGQQAKAQTASVSKYRQNAGRGRETPANHSAFHTMIKLRSEILRQAGATAEWRTGCVTALMDRGGVNLQPRSFAEANKKADQHPLIEVWYTESQGEIGRG